jgi:hypothetical protein
MAARAPARAAHFGEHIALADGEMIRALKTEVRNARCVDELGVSIQIHRAPWKERPRGGGCVAK